MKSLKDGVKCKYETNKEEEYREEPRQEGTKGPTRGGGGSLMSSLCLVPHFWTFQTSLDLPI